MAPKQQQQCAKYQYVVTSSGPKIVPVPEVESKDEESAADYNPGGYLYIKLNDTFKDGRYVVLRKLGCVASISVLPSHWSCADASSPFTSWGHFSTVWLVKDQE